MNSSSDTYIERRIITGLIVSTEYCQQIQSIWDAQLVASATAKRLASWCLQYFQEYQQAPQQDIQNIYTQKLQEGLEEDHAEYIETILDGLSDEYDPTSFNVEYLMDETKRYFSERKLQLHSETILHHVQHGNLSQAEEMALSYHTVASTDSHTIDLFRKSPEIERAVIDAFAERAEPLIQFPKALGRFWNHELTRDSFVVLLGPSKRGKSYILTELAIRALRSRQTVAYFQAGDMTKKQVIRRFGMYFAAAPDRHQPVKDIWFPEVDCVYNQIDACDRPERECSFGVFHNAEQGKDANQIKQAHRDFPEYAACRNCDAIKPTTWLTKKTDMCTVDGKKAYDALDAQYGAKFKLAVYPNNVLTTTEMESKLTVWKQQDQFVANVIVVDYLDNMAPDPDYQRLPFRHQRNMTTSRLRGISQKQHNLLISATQSDSEGHTQPLLGPWNFNEDRRILDHVTAMYGLNQTEAEKALGLMRINEIVARESDFNRNKPVTILQRLQIGRPFLGSYFEMSG